MDDDYIPQQVAAELRESPADIAVRLGEGDHVFVKADGHVCLLNETDAHRLAKGILKKLEGDDTSEEWSRPP